MAVLASFTLTATTAESKPRKRQQVERQKSSKSADSSSGDTDSGVRWRYGTAAIMVDANTGKVLYEQNADALRHPASVTKVMTLYLLFEQMEQGKLKLSSDLSVSAKAAGQSPSKLGVRAGSTIEVEDAIKAIVTRSANDVAVVIAENIGGSEAGFARMMTAKARALGMSRTTFVNASGLPNPRQVTTARDLSVLGRAIQDRFPKQYKYFGTRSFRYRGETIGNHNHLLGRIDGVDGIKTGYTRASGFNLLTNVERDGRHLVGVVLGGRSGRSRDDRMAELISDYLPRAYAGGRTVPKVRENEALASVMPEARPQELAFAAPLPQPVERDADDTDDMQPEQVVAALQAAPLQAASLQPAPLPPRAAPAAARVAPARVQELRSAPVPVARPEIVASAQNEPIITASIPVPALDPGKGAGAKSGAKLAALPDAGPAADPAIRPAVATAAMVPVAPAASAALAVQPSVQPAVQVGSAAPIQPTAVRTVSIQRPVMKVAMTTSLAPPTHALGYAASEDVSHFMPPLSATPAPAAKTAARNAVKAPLAAKAPPAAAVARAALREPTPEELERYEASVWPVFDDGPAVAAQAPAKEKAAKPVRTASLDPAPAPAARREAPPAAARSGWVIQIGAFDAERDARATLDLARTKAKSVLGKADPYTEAVTKGSTQLYRARFAGLDEKEAKKACRLLQRNDFACMTLRN